jgi:hypothetical protein
MSRALRVPKEDAERIAKELEACNHIPALPLTSNAPLPVMGIEEATASGPATLFPSASEFIREAADYAQHRRLERHIVLPGESFAADISLGKNILFSSAKVVDISSSGLSISVNASERGLQTLKSGTLVTVHLRMGHESAHYEFRALIRYISPLEKADQTRVGLEIDTPLQGEGEALEHEGYAIPETSPMAGFVYKGYFYHEKSIIKICSLGRDFFIIEVYDSSLIAIPGMPLAIHLFLPNAESNRIECVVDRLVAVRDKALVLRLKKVALIGKTTEWIASFLVQHAGFNPKIVRNLGFGTSEFSSSIRVRAVRTHEEYEAVLDLRWRAYAKVQKIDPSQWKPQDMAADTDRMSTILIAMHEDRIVGSISVTFPENDADMLDTEKPLPHGYPESIPPKRDLIELSRLCIDPTYQGSDLLIKLFAHVCRVGMISSRNHMITSSDAELWPLYKSMGFYQTGVDYSHPVFGTRHDLILYSRDRFVRAKGTGPLFWYMVYKGIYEYLCDYGVIHGKRPLKVKLYFALSHGIQLLRPFIKKFRKRKKSSQRLRS